MKVRADDHHQARHDAATVVLQRALLAAGIVGPILFVAVFTVAGWLRPRYLATAEVGAVALVAFSFVALNPASPLEDMGIGGLVERLLVIKVFAWHAEMGRRLLVHDATQSTAPPDGPESA
jgi:hypothetical protein